MKRSAVSIFTAAIFVAAFGFTASAAEEKKVSLSEAWKICKEDVDKNIPKSADHATQRYARAGACMKKLGYSL